MAKSTLAREKFINMVYGLGASIVILGALFKILHYQIGPLTGGVMLTIGLCTEAFIFAVSAFEPIKPKLDWSKVYPELVDGDAGDFSRLRGETAPDEVEESLSKKLDKMLKDAKIDGELMESLGASIKNFESAAKGIAPSAEALASQRKYSEEMSMAALQMESLNNLYKVQLESNDKQARANEAIAENAERLHKQMESLTENISNLNSVYGNMLSAMRPNK